MKNINEEPSVYKEDQKCNNTDVNQQNQSYINVNNEQNFQGNAAFGLTRGGLITVIIGCFIRYAISAIYVVIVLTPKLLSQQPKFNLGPSFVRDYLIALAIIGSVWATIVLIFAFLSLRDIKYTLVVGIMSIIAVLYSGLITLIGGILVLVGRSRQKSEQYARSYGFNNSNNNPQAFNNSNNNVNSGPSPVSEDSAYNEEAGGAQQGEVFTPHQNQPPQKKPSTEGSSQKGSTNTSSQDSDIYMDNDVGGSIFGAE